MPNSRIAVEPRETGVRHGQTHKSSIPRGKRRHRHLVVGGRPRPGHTAIRRGRGLTQIAGRWNGLSPTNEVAWRACAGLASLRLCSRAAWCKRLGRGGPCGQRNHRTNGRKARQGTANSLPFPEWTLQRHVIARAATAPFKTWCAQCQCSLTSRSLRVACLRSVPLRRVHHGRDRRADRRHLC